MKKIVKCATLAVTAAAILSAVGCAKIRNYSANSYQGVLPAGDSRPPGSTAPAPVAPSTAPAK